MSAHMSIHTRTCFFSGCSPPLSTTCLLSMTQVEVLRIDGYRVCRSCLG
jgi:hypothetical protein